MCVSPGPSRPPAVVPWIVWHMLHVRPMNTCMPRRCASVTGAGRLSCGFGPRLVFGGRLDDHGEPHVRVLVSAELGALPPERAGAVGADRQRGWMPRHQVLLAR